MDKNFQKCLFVYLTYSPDSKHLTLSNSQFLDKPNNFYVSDVKAMNDHCPVLLLTLKAVDLSCATRVRSIRKIVVIKENGILTTIGEVGNAVKRKAQLTSNGKKLLFWVS